MFAAIMINVMMNAGGIDEILSQSLG